MDNEFKLKNGSGCLCCCGCGKQDNKLNTYDWLSDIPGNAEEQDMVEVQFKNTRKGYYKNSNHIPLLKGDIVAVEASPGHDIGTVTLTGRLVPLQIKKANLKPDAEIKRIYRKAKPVDMEKYEEAKSREHATMIRSRKIAEDLGLQMKIGDVEYQGDGNKAIFYYIADERVDFRQLIKVLAEAFRVRIEMKQIGARQEAGRIGGIGPCGRELCCATWMKNFVSVSTSAARYQDISLNPQKLAGQCAKLKCCLNYEVDAYVECLKRLPSKEITLETADNTYYFFKADILGGTITYSTDKSFLANEATITARRAFEIINMNKRGEKPEKLIGDNVVEEKPSSRDLVEQESLTRFDKSKNKKKKGKNTDKGGAKPANEKGRSGKNGRQNGEQRNDQNNEPRKDQRGEQRNNQPNTEQVENANNGEQRGEQRNEQRGERNEQRGERNNRQRGNNRPNRNNRRPNGNEQETEEGQPIEGRSANEQRGEQRNEQRGERNEQRGERPDRKDQRPRGERRPKPEQRQNDGQQPQNEGQQPRPKAEKREDGEKRNNENRPNNERRNEQRGEKRNEQNNERRNEQRGEQRNEPNNERRNERRGERRNEPNNERRNEQRGEKRNEPNNERKNEQRGESGNNTPRKENESQRVNKPVQDTRQTPNASPAPAKPQAQVPQESAKPQAQVPAQKPVQAPAAQPNEHKDA